MQCSHAQFSMAVRTRSALATISALEDLFTKLCTVFSAIRGLSPFGARYHRSLVGSNLRADLWYRRCYPVLMNTNTCSAMRACGVILILTAILPFPPTPLTPQGFN
jgi:hypothetical protein